MERVRFFKMLRVARFMKRGGWDTEERKWMLLGFKWGFREGWDTIK